MRANRHLLSDNSWYIYDQVTAGANSLQFSTKQ